MSVTAEQICALLRGEGSDQLRGQFLAESGDIDSSVSRMLNAAAAWARAKLNDRSPSPSAETPLPHAVVTVLRKAAMWDDSGIPATDPDPKDLLDYMQGIASPAIQAAVKNALSDPESSLSRLLSRTRSKTD